MFFLPSPASTQMSNHYHLQCVPAHVSLPGNTESDRLANETCRNSSRDDQLQLEIVPATLRTILRQHERTRFHTTVEIDTHHHTKLRYLTCGLTKSNLQARRCLPRALQCLYSRWRIGQVDSCGSYPRNLNYLAKDLPCRFCFCSKESTLHLLSSCPGTLMYRIQHGLSLRTLQDDSAANIVAIAQFDDWISHTLPFDHLPPIQKSLSSSLKRFLDNQMSPSDQDHDDVQGHKRIRRSFPRSGTRENRKRTLVIHGSTWNSFRPCTQKRRKQTLS